MAERRGKRADSDMYPEARKGELEWRVRDGHDGEAGRNAWRK